MLYTTNYQFKLPQSDDPPLVADLNDNATAIDSLMKTHGHDATVLTMSAAAAAAIWDSSETPTDPTVEDALTHQATLQQYRWNRRGDNVSLGSATTLALTNIDYSSSTVTIYYADGYFFDADGTVNMMKSSYVSLSYNDATAANALAGKYIATSSSYTELESSAVYYVPTDATVTTDRGGIGYRTLMSVQLVTNSPTNTTVTSATRTTYPDYDYSGSYFYEYLGVPYLQWTKGSYEGTGTYGSSVPMTLTFSFVPRLVIISESTGMVLIMHYGGVTAYAVNNTITSTYRVYYSTAITDMSVSWWNSSYAASQMNAADTTYNYIAIG